MDTNTAHKAIETHLPAMRRAVAKVLRTSRHYGEANIDDVTADAAEYCLRKTLPAYDPSKGASVKTMLVRQAAKIALNFLGSAYARRVAGSVDCTDATAEDKAPTIAVDARDNAAEVALRRADVAALNAALGSLDAADEAFLRAYMELGSWKEAGATVGMTPVQATRAKARLFAQLRGMLG